MSRTRPNQITILLTPGAREEVEARSGRGSLSRSALISTLLERYGEVVRRHLPALSEDEWHLILEVTNGWVATDRPESVRYLWLEIEDLAPDAGAEATELAKKLQGLDYAELLAIVDRAERYWAAVGRGEEPAPPWEE